MVQEKVLRGTSGWIAVFVLVALFVGTIVVFVLGRDTPPIVLACVAAVVLNAVCWAGLTVVNPNTAKVVLLFGNYKGSIKTPGFWWFNPLTSRKPVSLRVRNFESGHLKVNDHIGNPIEIAAI